MHNMHKTSLAKWLSLKKSRAIGFNNIGWTSWLIWFFIL